MAGGIDCSGMISEQPPAANTNCATLSARSQPLETTTLLPIISCLLNDNAEATETSKSIADLLQNFLTHAPRGGNCLILLQ